MRGATFVLAAMMVLAGCSGKGSDPATLPTASFIEGPDTLQPIAGAAPRSTNATTLSESAPGGGRAPLAYLGLIETTDEYARKVQAHAFETVGKRPGRSEEDPVRQARLLFAFDAAGRSLYVEDIEFQARTYWVDQGQGALPNAPELGMFLFAIAGRLLEDPANVMVGPTTYTLQPGAQDPALGCTWHSLSHAPARDPGFQARLCWTADEPLPRRMESTWRNDTRGYSWEPDGFQVPVFDGRSAEPPPIPPRQAWRVIGVEGGFAIRVPPQATAGTGQHFEMLALTVARHPGFPMFAMGQKTLTLQFVSDSVYCADGGCLGPGQRTPIELSDVHVSDQRAFATTVMWMRTIPRTYVAGDDPDPPPPPASKDLPSELVLQSHVMQRYPDRVVPYPRMETWRVSSADDPPAFEASAAWGFSHDCLYKKEGREFLISAVNGQLLADLPYGCGAAR